MGRTLLAALLALVLSAGTQAQSSRMQIQFAEKVNIDASSARAEFDAYGRRFVLSLTTNDRLLSSLPTPQKARIVQSQVLRGTIVGVEKSWVRLARVNGALEGAIWDGHELYAVSSAARITPYLVNPLDAQSDQTVVYRLSDTINGLNERFCGVQPQQSKSMSSPVGATALQQYRDLVAELQAAAAAAPTDQLLASLIADTEFQNQFGLFSTEAMVARLNIVDGIFAEQVGVLIVPSELRLLPAGNPLISSDAETLLDQLASYREATPGVRSAGLAHLMTGKLLDGDTLGIGYIDSLCDPNFGASLGSSEDIPIANAVVMAHELGHNFGAEHDGVVGGACETTPDNFIMSPYFNGSTFFSQCSRDTMGQSVAAARGICITPANYADLSLSAPAATFAEVDKNFSVPFTVHSLGNRDATSTTLEVMIAPSLTFLGAVVDNGSCALNGITVQCTLTNVTAGENRVVELQFVGSDIAQFNLVAKVDADNDYLVDNNEIQYQVNVQSAVDARVTMSVDHDTVFMGDPFEVTVDVASVRSSTVHGATLYVNFQMFEVDEVTAGQHACTVFDRTVTCQLADIASGTSTRIRVRGHGTMPWVTSVTSNLMLNGDANQSDNYTFVNMTVLADREIRTTVSTEELFAVINTPYDITFTVTTAGRHSIDDVRFRVDAYTFTYGVVESVQASAGTCDSPSTLPVDCYFGTLAPGDVRAVVVRVRATQAGTWHLNGSSVSISGVLSNSASTTIRGAIALEVMAQRWGPAPSAITVGEVGGGYLSVQSVGAQLPQDLNATLEVAAPLRITVMNISSPGSGLNCVIETPQRARCSGALASRNNVLINYAFTGDVAGVYPATFRVTAAGDADPSNNSDELSLTVLPYLDAGITAAPRFLDLLVGEIESVEVTVTTGSLPVPGLKVVAASNLPYYEVESMSAAGFACQTSPIGASCDLDALPAGASQPVTVRYRALRDNAQGGLVIGVTATRDSNPANNVVNFSYATMAPTDLSLQVATSSISARTGDRFLYPSITVTNGQAMAFEVVVRITLPGWVSVDSISTTATCVGTFQLDCYLGVLTPGASRGIDIWLNANSGGTYNSDVTLRSANDTTAGNNAAAVSITATAPSTGGGGGGGSGNGGGGGGGSLEWLSLALLGLLVIQRTRRPIKSDTPKRRSWSYC